MSHSRVGFEATVDGERRRIYVDQRPEADLPAERAGVDRIEVTEPDARDYDATLPRLPIAGSGEPSKDTCTGDAEPIMACTDCGEPAYIRPACSMLRCPACWEKGVFNSVVNNPSDESSTGIGPKLEQYRLNAKNGRRVSNADGRDAKGPFFQHITVSLAGDCDVRFNSGDPLGQAFKLVYALLRITGPPRGKVAYHPWRIKSEYAGDVYGHGSGDGDMTWPIILDLIPKLGWETVRDRYLSFEPHFHVLSCGYFEPAAVDAIATRTGIVIHRIESPHPDRNVSIYGIEELCKAGAYSLSHAGIDVTTRADGSERGSVAARWFGRRLRNTKPSAHAVAKADDAFRGDAAYSVLGQRFERPECRAEHPDDDCGCAACSKRDGLADREPSEPIATATPTARARSTGTGTDGASTPSAGELTPADRDLSRPIAADGGTFDREQREPPGCTETCGGSLIPMYRVDAYLDDDDWTASIPDGTLDRLRDALERWRELAKPKPEAKAAPIDPPPGAAAD